MIVTSSSHLPNYYFSHYAIIISILAVQFWSCSDKRSVYEQQLKKHPYYDLSRTVDEPFTSDEPDHPDLAWQRDFLMTMDPSLGYPTPEKLIDAKKLIAKFKSIKATNSKSTAISWTERGPLNTGGRTRAFMWDPNDPTGKKAWAGGVTGGLWYTNNIYSTSTNWVRVDDFWSNLAISSITSDPNDPKVFYVGTGEGWGVGSSRGEGIWKTTDGGSNWQQLNSTVNFHYVNDLIVRNEGGISVIYTGVSNNAYKGLNDNTKTFGLQRSTDGGISWQQVLPNVPNFSQPFVASDIELAADNRIWVGTVKNKNGNGGATILYSDDGLSWTILTSRVLGSRVELACAPSNKSVIYAMIEANKTLHEIILSKDQGKSWTSIQEPQDADPYIPKDDISNGLAWYAMALAVDPNDENTVYAGSIDLFKSNDSGQNWKQLSHWTGGFGFPYCHGDDHIISFKSGSSSEAVIANDGGIYISTDLNLTNPTFTKRNRNYNVTQFYATSIHPLEGKHYFLAGSQDNGTQQFTLSGFSRTNEVNAGDGGYNFIDHKNGNLQILSYTYNTYYLSRDGGYTFSSISRDQTTGRFINPTDYDENLGILYSCNNENSIARFYNIREGIVSRVDLSLEIGSMPSCIKVSPFSNSSSTLFIGTSAGRLFKVKNANKDASLIELTGTEFSNGTISCIETGKTEDELLVVFSNYGVQSIWYSNDGGQSWAGKEGNLPNIPIRWAVTVPDHPEVVLIATELGVWLTTNFLSNSPLWEPANSGLANVRVDMLQLRRSDKELIAATYGRGLFSTSDLLKLDSAILRAHFTASTNQINSGSTIVFNDQSTGNPASRNWTFEGGFPASSSDSNPTITYPEYGQFSVKLKVQNTNGQLDSVTSEGLIKVLPVNPTPNLKPYLKPSWKYPLTISNEENDFTNQTRISDQKDIYISYSFINNGNAKIDQNFSIGAYIDTLVYLDDWNYSPTQAFGLAKPSSVENGLLGKMAAGFYALTLNLDDHDSIPEMYENDNKISLSFEVEPSCADTTYLFDGESDISDGSLNHQYLNNLDCKWLIAPTNNPVAITISFTEFDLDQSDTLFIYANNDYSKPLYQYSESTLPNDLKIEDDTVVLQFFTDNSSVNQGWGLHYTAIYNLPDLIVSKLSAIDEDFDISVEIEYENRGNTGLKSPAVITFYLSSDTLLSYNDRFLKSFFTTTLSPFSGESSSLSISKTFLTPGDYNFIAVIDGDSIITESNDSNNSRSVFLTITPITKTLSFPKTKISIYPIPANDLVKIECPEIQNGNYSLFNMSGIKLQTGQFNAKLEMSSDHLDNGIYLIVLSNSSVSAVKKILIQH